MSRGPTTWSFLQRGSSERPRAPHLLQSTIGLPAVHGFRPRNALRRTFRRSSSRRRPRRMRGRHGRRPHGPQDRPLHAQRRSNRANVLQPRHRRHRQRTPGPRSRCPRRHHGRNHRRRWHPVPPAQHFARPGSLVSARPVRQTSLSPEDARGPGIAAESEDQASRSGGCDSRAVSRQLVSPQQNAESAPEN